LDILSSQRDLKELMQIHEKKFSYFHLLLLSKNNKYLREIKYLLLHQAKKIFASVW